jgi:hypothetical protein
VGTPGLQEGFCYGTWIVIDEFEITICQIFCDHDNWSSIIRLVVLTTILWSCVLINHTAHHYKVLCASHDTRYEQCKNCHESAQCRHQQHEAINCCNNLDRYLLSHLGEVIEITQYGRTRQLSYVGTYG